MDERDKGQGGDGRGNGGKDHFKHIEWVDNDDGTNRKKVTRSKRRQRKIPPRPVPKAVPELHAKPAKFGVYKGEFGRLEAKRLLDRAGFGARPGEAKELARKGLKAAVHSLTRPKGQAKLKGPGPHDDDGLPLAPNDAWGHDHLWWLDRMVRSDQPLVERMALVLHDWFATSNEGVDRTDLMLAQNETLRRMCLGSFADLVVELTRDPAMLIWLDGVDNHKRYPNENYSRELQELFCLGADRGAYSEDDVREMARALTGWRATWVDDVGYTDFRYDSDRHDAGQKTIYGQTGAFTWADACRLVVEHPMHPEFFVTKLWSYFIPTPPSKDTARELRKRYRESGYQIRPVLEAILMHPDFYRGPRMVKPPVVHLASMLRARRRPIQTDAWVWLSDMAGQVLFYPPNVAGWDDARWLDTSTMRARWHFVTYLQDGHEIEVWPEKKRHAYSDDEGSKEAVNRALAYWDWPPLTERHRRELISFASKCLPRRQKEWERSPYRAMRQNALRHLLAVSPDFALM